MWPNTQLICVLVVQMSLYWNLKRVVFFPILILETTLKSVSNRRLQWPLYVLRDRLTAGCGLRWPYCKTPKPTAYFPKGKLKTHSLWAHFCGVLLWWRIRQGAFAWQLIPMHIPNTTFPIEHYFPLFLLYITFAFTMLFIWARNFLYMQSLHKSCKGQPFFPPKPEGIMSHCTATALLIWKPAGGTHMQFAL